MNCRAFRTLIDDLLDDSLGQEDAQQAREHMSTCGRCRQEYEETHNAVLAIRAVPEAALPIGMIHSFRAYAERRDAIEAKGPLGKMHWAWKQSFSSACLGMILFITVVSANATRRLQKYVVPAG